MLICYKVYDYISFACNNRAFVTGFLFYSFPVDGAVHNLNEYMEIHSDDAVATIKADLVNDVRNERLGVVVSETQIEEFFSLST